MTRGGQKSSIFKSALFDCGRNNCQGAKVKCNSISKFYQSAQNMRRTTTPFSRNNVPKVHMMKPSWNKWVLFVYIVCHCGHLRMIVALKTMHPRHIHFDNCGTNIWHIRSWISKWICSFFGSSHYAVTPHVAIDNECCLCGIIRARINIENAAHSKSRGVFVCCYWQTYRPCQPNKSTGWTLASATRSHTCNLTLRTKIWHVLQNQFRRCEMNIVVCALQALCWFPLKWTVFSNIKYYTTAMLKPINYS